MTNYFVRTKDGKNKDIIDLTPEEWNELMISAARQGDGAAGWRWAMSLARWIKENVIVIMHKKGDDSNPEPFTAEYKTGFEKEMEQKGIPLESITCQNCGEPYSKCGCEHFMPAKVTTP